jgi:hypothetical protein
MKGTIGLGADDIDRLTATLIHLGRHELDRRGRPISDIKDNRLSGRGHISEKDLKFTYNSAPFYRFNFIFVLRDVSFNGFFNFII